jgi:hypothetical protein
MAQLMTKGGVPLAPGASVPDINALLGGVVDRKKWYWYDTLKLAPGGTVSGTPYTFFSVAQGQQDPNNASAIKTFLETNIMPPGGQFSSPYDMVLTNLGFFFDPLTTLYDIDQIMKFGYFQFTILEKVFFKGHLWRHPPGAGMTGVSTQTTESAYGLGVADPASIYYFGQWSKYIPPLTSFQLTLQFFETVGVATSGTNGGTLPALNTFYGQSGSALPTLRTTGQGGNGVWLIAFMNGLSDGPVQKNFDANGVDGDPNAVNRLGCVGFILQVSSSNAPCV